MSGAQHIEEQLRKASERLAAVNLRQNEALKSTEQIVEQINALKIRCDKKRKLIEQEISDKMLIHQKLVRAQAKLQDLHKKKSVAQPDVPMTVESHPPTASEAQQQNTQNEYGNSQKGEYKPPFEFENDEPAQTASKSQEIQPAQTPKEQTQQPTEQPDLQAEEEGQQNHEDLLARIRQNMNLGDDEDEQPQAD